LRIRSIPLSNFIGPQTISFSGRAGCRSSDVPAFRGFVADVRYSGEVPGTHTGQTILDAVARILARDGTGGLAVAAAVCEAGVTTGAASHHLSLERQLVAGVADRAVADSMPRSPRQGSCGA
jgi:hypothetical protein